jgi:hypothetical protein
VQFQHSLSVVLAVGMHAADEAEVVGAFRDFGKNLADVKAALAGFLEGERRLHQFRVRIDEGTFDEILWKSFAGVAFEERFVIEGVDVRRAAVHEKENDAFGRAE